MSKRLEDVRNLAEGLVEIQVDFIDKDTRKKQPGLIFLTYENFGKWMADNYDVVKILKVITSDK
ncbi:hypothetical protein [uncultured Clostridium sp.]|uniref:hypothetical protein n=1 Tax=uncultured Clostridium sp. TaxID=59620 RepID=UPI0025D33123|nr:hypothetical protein [uncultured Clostridium sp.]